MTVLKGIAFTMADVKMNNNAKELEETIESLGAEAKSEDTVLKKEEDEILQLKEQIRKFKCDCAYDEWAKWSSCTKTCGNDGIQTRQRVVKWEARNGGRPCLEKEKTSKQPCNIKCCRTYIFYH